MLTEKRNPRSLIKTNSSASLHANKANKGKTINTQRLSHRKNLSAHSTSKLESDIYKAYKVTSQKPLLSQLKSKKYMPQFSSNTFTNRNSCHLVKR